MVIFTNLDNIWDKSSSRHTWKNLGSTVQHFHGLALGSAQKWLMVFFSFRLGLEKVALPLALQSFHNKVHQVTESIGLRACLQTGWFGRR
jgi:hypothetical protein